MTNCRVTANPNHFEFNPRSTTLLMVDFQNDFMRSGGFGELLGNNAAKLQRAVQPARRVLEACRKAGITVIHTREGHLPDLSDCPKRKLESLPKGKRIGDKGPMGRILVRGEKGHAIITELAPLKRELVIDKPGKDAFYKTRLSVELKKRGITHLIIAGVTTNVCVDTTVKAANDRGFHCLVLSDATAAYQDKFHKAALDIIASQGGIFGKVTHSRHVLNALLSKYSNSEK